MSKTPQIVADSAMAAAEPRFVAPELIDASGGKPRLIAGKCRACGALSFPKAPVCAACLAQEIGETHLASEGVLYAFATVHQAPRNWIVPYHLGYVDLTDGIRVLAHIDGEPKIDGRVRLGVARVGTSAEGAPLMSYVFTPVSGASA